MQLKDLREGDVFTSTKDNGKIYELLEDPNPKKKTVRVKPVGKSTLNALTKLQDMEVRTTFDCDNCDDGEVEDNGPKPCPMCGGNGYIDLKTL